MDLVADRLSYHIVIPGHPCSENRRLANRRFVLSDEYRTWKAMVGWQAVAQGVRTRIGGAVRVRIEYHHEHEHRFQDCSSLLKGCLDALNGVAWQDDAQIMHIQVERRWDPENPRVELWIEEVPAAERSAGLCRKP